MQPAWTEHRQKVFDDRYALRDADGNVAEKTPQDMWRRVADALGRSKEERKEFYGALEDFKFVPAGRQLTGLGSGKTSTLMNCFVVPFSNPGGSGADSRASIMETMSRVTEITARGGGVGLNWSVLRPKNAIVEKVRGVSSGPMSWAVALDGIVKQVVQGGSRRGACMFVMEAWHPDIMEFITIKRDLTTISTANLSVAVSENFMHAVEKNEDWELVFPVTKHEKYDAEWDGDIEKWREKGYPIKVYERIKARKIWKEIIAGAHGYAEPGLVFLERINELNNTGYMQRLIGTNPCATGDTRMMIRGEVFYTIAEIAASGKDYEFATPNGYAWGRAWKTGNKETVKITFNNETSITLTPDHRMLSVDGWVRADESMGKEFDYNCEMGPIGQKDSVVSVVGIKPNGVHEVYDFSVDNDSHAGLANGVIIHNCGELPLAAYGVCCLGSVNLLSHLIDGDGIDYQSLGKTVRAAVRFLDAVIDKESYILPQIEEEEKRVRRIGMGTMGLADVLAVKGIRYGSRECLAFIDEVYSFIRDTAYDASLELAKELGPAPAYDEAILTRPFIQTLPELLIESIQKHGLRNLVLLTQAPTGTTSIIAGVSSGIEPIFAKEYTRSDRTGVHNIKYWLADLGYDFSTAQELPVEDHIAVQARVQKYVDNSISKTINAQKHATEKDTERAFKMAYDLGCKGVTYYRDGSREGVLTIKEQEVDGAVRPHKLQGVTHKVTTPLGNMYVTVNYHHERPFEVYCHIGKAGSDLTAFTEAIGRLVSVSLQHGIPVEEVCHQLGGIGGASSIGLGINRVRSVPDAIATVLGDKGNGQVETGEICPNCGHLLVMEEGCQKCYNCATSKC